MKIGLLGHGVVGGGVSKIIDDGPTWEVRELEVAKILVKDKEECVDPRCTTDPNDILNDRGIDVVAECMGGLEPAHEFALRALSSGKSLVSSNKKMLATYGSDLFDAAHKSGAAVHYEAACGGGIPWMASLDRIRRVDDITSFRGIFNGTTNYILCRMTKEHADFADMLLEAQRLGYAERDPGDDIDGFDVRYKVSLSLVKAYDALTDANAITTYGIRHILKDDLAYCRDNGLVCKLLGSGICQGDKLCAFVIPTFMDENDVFADISLNFNAIESDSQTLGKAVFIGQGAGSLPTAHALVQNIIDIGKDQDSKINRKELKTIDNSLYKGVFYVRTSKPEAFAALPGTRISDNTFLTKEISLADMDRAARAAHDDVLFLAEVKR